MEIPRQQALDGGLSPDRHEHRRFDIAMRRVQNPRPRPRMRTSGLDFEAEHWDLL